LAFYLALVYALAACFHQQVLSIALATKKNIKNNSPSLLKFDVPLTIKIACYSCLNESLCSRFVRE
jgi:hypothetical protein